MIKVMSSTHQYNLKKIRRSIDWRGLKTEQVLRLMKLTKSNGTKDENKDEKTNTANEL